MQLYEWGEKYSAEFEPINNQHRVFLGQINKLLYNQRRDKNKIVLLLNELMSFLEFHFNSEENFMLIFKYEEIETHRTAHEKLIGEMKSKIELYKDEKTDLEDIVKTIVIWFVSHTAKIDKKLGAYLKEKSGENGRFL